MEGLQLEKRPYAKQEYFEQLSKSQHKLEYISGEIRMMSGGTLHHGTIVDNVFFNLRTNKGACHVRSSEMAVAIQSQNRYYFPDASVVCGEDLKLEDNKGIARMTNPCLIVEVISNSSVDIDRVEKFHAYRQLDSFKEYLLVDSRKMLIETFYREASDLWHIRSYFKEEQEVYIRTLDVNIPVSTFYEGVQFEMEEN
ncbi:MAG: Uma2 family endonuclease [Lewinella sp.]